MAKTKAKNVDEYINHAAEEAQPLLKELRRLIKSAVPAAEESICWSVPFYKYHGALAGFAVYRNHISFGIAKGTLDASEREALEQKGYTTGIRTIRISFDQKLPAATIKRILRSVQRLNVAKRN